MPSKQSQKLLYITLSKVLPISILVMIILGMVMIKTTQDSLLQETNTRIKQRAYTISISTNERFRNILDVVRDLSKTSIATKVLIDHESNDQSYMSALLRSFQVANLSTKKLSILDYKGRIITGDTIDNSDKDNSLVSTVMQGEEVISLKADKLLFAVPIRYLDNVEGILYLEVKLEVLAEYLGETLPAGAELYKTTNNELIYSWLAKTTKTKVETKVEMITHTAPLPLLPKISVLYAESEEVALAYLNQLHNFLLIILLLSLLALVVAIVYAGYSIVKPIHNFGNHLNSQANKTSDNSQVSYTGTTEVDELIDVYNKLQISREQLYKKLKEQLNTNTQILSSMREGLVVTNPEGLIIQTNPEFLRLTGYTEDEINMSKLQVFLIQEETLLCKDKTEIPVSVSKAHLTSPSGVTTGGVIVIHDMQEHYKLEQERQKSAYQAGIAEMSSTVLHNIGNAVTPLIERSYQLNVASKDIIQIASIVEDVYTESKITPEDFSKNNEEAEKLFNVIQRLPDALRQYYQDHLSDNLQKLDTNVTHIADIVQVQQSLVRGSVSDYVETFNLTSAIEDSILLLSSSLEKTGIKVELDIQVKKVTLPHNLFVQMINNLIKNAKEAIDTSNNSNSGIIKIQATAESEQNFCLNISDNGCGVELEKQEKIFNFGYTNKDAGSGFGLHSVANFIQSLGGKIRIISDGKNKGTTFSILLPIKA